MNEDPTWQVVEDGYDPARLNAYETLFTVGNGYLGTRGSFEESHEGSLPGTFLRGVFDHHDSAVMELVKAPDWVALAVEVDGTRLDVTSSSVVRHRRVLDMRDGTLSRETVFEDSEGRRTRVETVRFASSADQHLCCLQVRITRRTTPRRSGSAAVSTAPGTTWIGGRSTRSRPRTTRR